MLLPGPIPEQPISKHARLTRPEVGLLLKLHEVGKTQVEIAQTLGCSQSVISYWLAELGDTRTEAKHVIHNGAQKLAKRVIDQADVDQSLDVLERIEVIAPKQTQVSQAGVQILIGMPGNPAGPDPILQVNGISNYQTQKESAALTGQQLTATDQGQIEAKVEGESQS